jgi:glutamyl-tRNA synthetase
MAYNGAQESVVGAPGNGEDGMNQINGPVRVRFAPSPTGYLHIGGVRTALFNWLFARHYGGQFILRIEDTDEKRYVPGAADNMIQSLKWIGITWDEGPDIGGPHAPYVQSERSSQGIYRRHIEQLLAGGHAYMSFATEADLTRMRAEAEAQGLKSFRFRGVERDWPLERQRELAESGKPHTIRLKMPLAGETVFSDLVRGGEQIRVNNEQLQDIVLIKSSGMPVYHFAHLVDDYMMGVTHVIRGEEWVPSTPYHVQLYNVFGWSLPTFAHVPNILRQDGRGKLSKRKDDVATNRFWENGYLPEAMFNYLALQGWSFDDHTEIMSINEIVERFTIERVQASPARWNPEKLKDMNGIYIRKLPVADLAEQLLPFMIEAGLINTEPSPADRAYLTQLVPLIHERLEELREAPGLLDFFFQDIRPADEHSGTPGYDPSTLIQKKFDAGRTGELLEAAHQTLADLSDWTAGTIEATLRELLPQMEIKAGPLFGAIRVAVSGRTVAPPLFDMLTALGKERALARIALARESLRNA